jgi:hypothetical protein
VFTCRVMHLKPALAPKYSMRAGLMPRFVSRTHTSDVDERELVFSLVTVEPTATFAAPLTTNSRREPCAGAIRRKSGSRLYMDRCSCTNRVDVLASNAWSW